LLTPPAAVFVEVVKGRTLRKFELAADATAYSRLGTKMPKKYLISTKKAIEKGRKFSFYQNVIKR
jgi:hypothetical protein